MPRKRQQFNMPDAKVAEPELKAAFADVTKEQYLKTLAMELHKPVKHKFPTRMVFVAGKDNTWGMDLADMSHWKDENKGTNWILTIIDVFTRFAWARPLKTKTLQKC